MKSILLICFVLVLCLISGGAGWWFATQQSPLQNSFLSPILDSKPQDKPLQRYGIAQLATQDYQSSQIKIEKILAVNADFVSYQFSFVTLNKKMTGQLNIPQLKQDNPQPAIIMLRGYVPVEIYETGVGTRNAAAVFAKNGFITVAPDFFGYGGSDPEPNDTWQARFEKPVIVIELLKTLKSDPLIIDPQTFPPQPSAPTAIAPQTIHIGNIGLWGHSNGGQIALTTLEVLQQSLPTTLWAPVTAPFPYSLLFFSDENQDEGKEMRRWLAIFEKEYDVFDFSLTQHLDRLQGPLQLHHGTADEAALKVWSDEFADKITIENRRRAEMRETMADNSTASPSASPTPLTGVISPAVHPTTDVVLQDQNLDPIKLTYYSYPGADHNLQPSWDLVVARDVAFFKTHLEE